MYMKNILITTDFSDNATHAIDYALHLLQNEPCRIYLLHVVKASSFISDDLMQMNPSSSLYEQLIGDDKKKLDNLISSLSKKDATRLHEFIPVVDYDNFIGSIKQCIENNNIELVVMGTKGATNSIKKLFGSNTLRVIENVTVPVLAIPELSKIKAIKNVVFTSNLNRSYDPKNLEFLIRFVETYNCRVHILHFINDDSIETDKLRVKQQLDGMFKQTIHSDIDDKASEFLLPLIKYIETNGIDMFSMVSPKHSFFDKIFNEQKIESVANHLKVPILAFTSMD